VTWREGTKGVGQDHPAGQPLRPERLFHKRTARRLLVAGRGWRGFHHHAALVMLAYGFLLLERERVRVERDRAGGRPAPRKKGSPSGR
jgi:hypothetical protein